MKSQRNAHTPPATDDKWRWLVNLQAYHRHPSFTPAEREALALLNDRFRVGAKAWPEPVRTALTRLL